MDECSGGIYSKRANDSVDSVVLTDEYLYLLEFFIARYSITVVACG